MNGNEITNVIRWASLDDENGYSMYKCFRMKECLQ